MENSPNVAVMIILNIMMIVFNVSGLLFSWVEGTIMNNLALHKCKIISLVLCGFSLILFTMTDTTFDIIMHTFSVYLFMMSIYVYYIYFDVHVKNKDEK